MLEVSVKEVYDSSELIKSEAGKGSEGWPTLAHHVW